MFIRCNELSTSCNCSAEVQIIKQTFDVQHLIYKQISNPILYETKTD